MAFTEYTTPASVRAVLGISEKEARDVVITDTVYLTALLEALHDLDPGVSAAYTAASSATPRSATQARFTLLVQTYCAYVVAIKLIPNLPMLAPQIITDGKTALNRIANPYEHLLAPLQASALTLASKILAVYTTLTPGYVAPLKTKRTMVVSTGSAFDNVTGV